MPKKLEESLMRVYDRMKKKHKAKGSKDSFVYGTMTNMQKRGEIAPWRKLNKKDKEERNC